MEVRDLLQLRDEKIRADTKFLDEVMLLIKEAIQQGNHVRLLILRERDRDQAVQFLEYMGHPPETDKRVEVKRVKWEDNVIKKNDSVITFPLSLTARSYDSLMK